MIQSYTIDYIAFKKNQMHSGCCEGSQERVTPCYIYDLLFIFVRLSFVLSSFQYHNALLETQIRYRRLS